MNKIHVLAVDDEPIVRKFLCAALRGANYTVLEADCATQALELCASAPPIRLIVTDVVMPGKSGPEMVEALRQIGIQPPVLYISGYPEGLLAEKHLPPGVLFLSKPFTSQQLKGKVAEALAQDA